MHAFQVLIYGRRDYQNNCTVIVAVQSAIWVTTSADWQENDRWPTMLAKAYCQQIAGVSVIIFCDQSIFNGSPSWLVHTSMDKYIGSPLVPGVD